MKQIIQDLKNGNTILEEIPTPLVRSGCVLIKTHASLVSLGTEKMLVEFGKGNLISKARQQPDKVKQVLSKIKTEGLLPTLEAVFNKLGEPLPLGYCNAGEVIAVGNNVTEFSIGDRVASNGPHAEIVCVPKNLVAKIPSNVSYEEAAFTVVGSIGLQGIRLANPTLGETIVVIGLGLIGLLTVDLLKSIGCNVIGFDFDDHKVELAKNKGINAFNNSNTDVVKLIESFTQGIGADAVLITASTKSDEVISLAAQMSRKRGRIILIGVIGLNIQRADFYKKELTFQVSCSYGPGRYDEDYEQKGIDYPIGYVRWTQKRNFETILNSISLKQITVKDLITERIELVNYMEIYGNLGKGSIASIIKYPLLDNSSNSIIKVGNGNFISSSGTIGIIGAGNFTKMTLLPSLKKSEANLKYISSAGGLTAQALAKKYSFEFATTDYKKILEDSTVDLVMITTRHDNHAQLVVECINSNKHVFVEKPLAINEEQLKSVESSYLTNKNKLTLTVGFNRRFSPFIQKAKTLISSDGANLNMVATINAGFIPNDTWIQDINVGGGRIVGEACHFIDLMTFLSGSLVKSVVMNALGVSPQENSDNVSIILKFENGAQGIINYFSNGSKLYSKERIEIYNQGRILVIDNFRKMTGYGFKNFNSMSSRIDKGHFNQFKLLIDRIKNGGDSIIPYEEILNTTKTTFAAVQSLKTKSWINIF